MAEETKKEEGFFKKVLKSIKDFDKYEDFALEGKGVAFKYLIKLIAIFCAIVCIAYTAKIVTNVNKLYIGLKEKLPEFSYQEGKLSAEAEEPTIIEDYGEFVGTIILDTNIEQGEIKEKYNENINKFGAAVVFTKDAVQIYNSSTNLTYKYTDVLANYNVQNFNKQDVVNEIEKLNVVSISLSVYCVMYLYLFILYFVSIMIDVLILSLLAYIVSRFSRIKLKYEPSFNVAAHSITLPVLLNLTYIIVNLFTGFEIKYFQIMYNTISYIYVVVAILMIKTDFINRQAELIKIAQEQLKVKEELEKQKEEEKEKPKEDKKEKQEDDSTKEKNKEKKKKEESSDEPIGDATFNSTDNN